ncbi:MAG: hypothetical protein CVU89_05275 [Firmicutes bacterium HGW-Firmicutes-14]|nr:MAG: hypothetical protein CVU89_05275 [Firmicutes bacterium HGW-Firmicutes-14]
MKLVNLTRNTVLADTAEVAGTWFSRLKGLMFRKGLADGHSLVLVPCSSVHSCFMRFNIDLLFVDRAGTVVYLTEDMPPFRFSPLIREAGFIVELPSGTIRLTGTCLNDRLNLTADML